MSRTIKNIVADTDCASENLELIELANASIERLTEVFLALAEERPEPLVLSGLQIDENEHGLSSEMITIH